MKVNQIGWQSSVVKFEVDELNANAMRLIDLAAYLLQLDYYFQRMIQLIDCREVVDDEFTRQNMRFHFKKQSL